MSMLEIYAVADRAEQEHDARDEGALGASMPPIEGRAGRNEVGRLRRGAVLGGLLWLALLLPPPTEGSLPDAILRLVLLGVLVVIPLGLALLLDRGVACTSGARRRQSPIRLPPSGAWAVSAAGWLVAASTRLPDGWLAGLLALPWLLLALWVNSLCLGPGLAALGRDASRRLARRRTAEATRAAGEGNRSRGAAEGGPSLAASAGLLWWAIGAAWLLATRAGIDLGFGSLVALLTAAHFHFAGFGAAVMVATSQAWLSRAGRSGLGRRGGATLSRAALAAVVLGLPLVAAGIGLGSVGPLARSLERSGVLTMSLGLLAQAWLQLRWIAPSLASRLARLLMRVSGASLLLSMPLALAYGLRVPGLSIPDMLAWHGRLNAVGFVLCGLLALSIAREDAA